MKNIKFISVFLILLAIALNFACKKDLIREREILLQTDREFSQMSVAKGAAEAFYEYLAEDAIQLLSNANPLFGKEDIYQGMQEAGQNYELKWEPKDGQVAKSGDLGWTWGTYLISVKLKDGQLKTGYGKYLNVWEKDQNGKWKVKVDMGNLSPAPEN
jgi:ketosteroid isomerase-like protein